MPVQRYTFRVLVLIITTLLSSLIMTGASNASVPGLINATNAANGCSPNQNSTYSIYFVYQSSLGRTCEFKDQESFLAAYRDGVARGASTGEYREMQVQELKANGFVAIDVTFKGYGPSSSVQTADWGGGTHTTGAFDGPSGWTSATQARCNGTFITATGSETLALRDFAYHIGQIVKSNASGPGGIAAAKLTAASGTTVLYSPYC